MVDNLREEYTIDTPENVSFSYDVVGIGSRFIGVLVDTILMVILLAMLNIILFMLLGAVAATGEFSLDAIQNSNNWLAGVLLAIYAFINFALFWGYYILFEWLWNGQSPGKRVARTRVMRVDGSPVGMTDVIVRNLVRIIDFLPFGYGVGLLTMVSNRQARRLGDFAAGTLVVRDQGEIELSDLEHWMAPDTPSLESRPDAEAQPAPLIPGVRQLSAADIDLITEGLARADQQRLPDDFIRRLALAIASKLALPAPAEPTLLANRRFLEEVVLAYSRSVSRSESRS
jgi:uncharacterized RDD family membrane protein YckC